MNENSLEEKWTKFIDSLEGGNYGAEKGYFEAIKYVSDIKVDEIDDDATRAKIENNIKVIVDFLKSHDFLPSHKDYYELGNIKGFKTSEGKITGRDYYYYIADQQMKATVYYARYLNFIDKCEINEQHEQNVIKRLEDYCGMIGLPVNKAESSNNVVGLCDKIIDAIVTRKVTISEENRQKLYELVYKQKEDNNADATSSINNEKLVAEDKIDISNLLNDIYLELLRYKEEWKIAQNLEYKIYMMLNNMLREIRFFGAAYQYLWHWNKHKKNLYRSGRLDECNGDSSINKSVNSKKDFLKQMFTDCISHMNSPSNKRHSFSENLLLDVYKYLILPKPKPAENTVMEVDGVKVDGLTFTCNALENKNEVEFYIIKNSTINSIVTSNQDQKVLSFYEYVIGDALGVEGYSVEMYPQDLLGERNAKGTVKGMRDTLLPLYFSSWGIDASLSKTTVADDKEVITYGKFYNAGPIEVNDKPIKFNDSYDDEGTLFKIQLNKEDILTLLLKIYQKKEQKEASEVVNSIVKKIVRKMEFNPKLKDFSYFPLQGYYNRFIEGKSNTWEPELKFRDVNSNSFMIQITANEKYKTCILQKVTVQEVPKQLESNSKKCISDYLTERYSQAIQESNNKVDFILSTVSDDNEFDFELIRQYNEYMADEEDSEIAMLKYIIFKEE